MRPGLIERLGRSASTGGREHGWARRLVLYKSRYSGFFATDLDATLRDLGIETLLFVGATTSVCVESTVRDAMFRDFHCVVVEDCTAEPIGIDLPRSNHEASLLVLQLLFASISGSSAVIAALRRPAVSASG